MILPTTMRAVGQSGPGGPEVLRVEHLAVPAPKPGEVLIRVEWAGLNPHDLNQRNRGAPPPGQTPIFGLECSGEVVAVGDAGESHRIGSNVCALVPGGAYAEYCISPAGLAFDRPAGFTNREAAALMENLFTVWFNMMELAGLQSGERMLVHGGTGNIGSTAIQIANLIGAQSFGTVGSEEKRKLCLEIGAKAAINYRTENVVEAVLAATGGKGVDVIFETVGTDYNSKNLDMIAKDGRIVYINGGKGANPSVPISAIMQKRARVMGSLMRPLELPRKLKVAAELKARIWPVLGSKVRPLIDSEFTLETAADAHRRSESGEAAGKILLKVV